MRSSFGGHPDPADLDVWISCVPSDSSDRSLVEAIAQSLELPRDAGFDDVAAAVWLRAPARVCFMLDDVHEIAPASPGAAVLQRLVDELPNNAHLVFASRSPVAVTLARLAARQQLERISEDDLLFDESELDAFAAARRADRSVVGASQGWPALAELAATAADDLVVDYVWDEVVSAIGQDRTRCLAALAAIGVADDTVAGVLGVDSVATLVDGLPLVERRAAGWIALHPLWQPVLRPVLTTAEVDDVRRAAASIHCVHRRFDDAIRLLAESRLWDDVIAAIRTATLDPSERMSGRAFGRWAALVPNAFVDHPAVRFALALDAAARLPAGAADQLAATAERFRSTGDLEGELAALNEYGFELWWANDVIALIGVIGRVGELAAAGCEGAELLVRIGQAGVAHIGGDSAGVLAALEGIEEHEIGVWASGVAWLRHVAHRRLGDLVMAELALEVGERYGTGAADPQLRLARARTDWLRGHVDRVPADMRSVLDHYRQFDNRYLHAEVSLELAAKLAWLGDANGATAVLDQVRSSIGELPGSLARVLWLVGSAALSIDAGDERRARELLEAEAVTQPGRDDSWYWCDRAALAMLWVLLPEHRAGWEAAVRSPVHRPGVELARALVATREGDATAAVALVWPDPGIARAHLPRAWLVELMCAASAVGNPAPPALTEALGPIGPRAIADGAPVTRDARPVPVARISVLGPLAIRLGDEEVEPTALRRRRVRELLAYLVVHRRVRREAVADALWPDIADPRHNLRVTLSYLRGAIEQERTPHGDAAYLHADQSTISFVMSRVRCDLWELDDHLGRAECAEREGRPADALDSYDRALDVWAGPPFDDIVDSDWARDEQTRWRRRFGAAAVRCGELHLAAGTIDGAKRAAEQAIATDPVDETAYQLLARAHLAAGDARCARRTLDECIAALHELGVAPTAHTTTLLDSAATGTLER